LPIRFNRDNRYVDEPIQMMPRDGYTNMFERMLSHRLIRVLLNSDFLKLRHGLKARKAFVYTGPVDAYFNFCYGALPWRSLDFEWIELNRRFYQPCVTINYPSESEFRYTRSVEIKHVTGQESRSTVISFEYPLNGGDPFYPVPTRSNLAQYSLYKDLADKETIGNGVYFCGRLATYRYLNIDQAMEEAFGLLEQLKERDAAGAGTGRCALP